MINKLLIMILAISISHCVTAGSSNARSACETFKNKETKGCYVEAGLDTKYGIFMSVVPGDGMRHILLQHRNGNFEPIVELPEVDYYDSKFFFLDNSASYLSNILVVEDHYLETEEYENPFQWQIIDINKHKEILIVSALEPPTVELGSSWILLSVKSIDKKNSTEEKSKIDNYCIYAHYAKKVNKPRCAET